MGTSAITSADAAAHPSDPGREATATSSATPSADAAAPPSDPGREAEADSLLSALSFDSQDTEREEAKEEAEREMKRAKEEAEREMKRAKTREPEPIHSEPKREAIDARSIAAAECAGFPISFRSVSLSDEEAVDAVCCIAGSAESFYVGVTAHVLHRWLGRNTERGNMRGHCKTYDYMVIVATRCSVAAAASLEKRCITAGKEYFASASKNIAEDARGISGGVNFVYIVYK